MSNVKYFNWVVHFNTGTPNQTRVVVSSTDRRDAIAQAKSRSIGLGIITESAVKY